MENEIIEDFNTKFRQVLADLHDDITPNNTYILIYYIKDFSSDLRYQLRDKEPVDLKATQIIAEKIETNMQSFGKSNIP